MSREKWIRQILSDVTGVHARGTVVGCIELGAVGVTCHGRAVLTSFKTTGSHWPNRRDYLLPELRRDIANGPLLGHKALTFQSDISQLGLVIWLLAQHASTACGIFCVMSHCVNVPHFRCDAEHTNPITLPQCLESIPDYIQEHHLYMSIWKS